LQVQFFAWNGKMFAYYRGRNAGKPLILQGILVFCMVNLLWVRLGLTPERKREYVCGMKTKLITRTELMGLVGVTGQKVVKTWELGGLPFVKRRGAAGGKPAHLYEREAALRWLRGHASFAVAYQARKAMENLEKEPPEEAEDDPCGADTVEAEDGAERAAKHSTGAAVKSPLPCWNGEPGVEGAFARMVEAELAFSRLLNVALAKGQLERAAKCAEQVVAFAVGMAKVEAHLQGRKGGAGAVEAVGDAVEGRGGEKGREPPPSTASASPLAG
jgi:hypothetical protein